MGNKGIPHNLRLKVLERDNFECKKCGESDLTGTYLQVHHIDPHFKSQNNNINNLITLCITCHKYAPNSKEEFEEYISDQIDGAWTIFVKAYNKIKNQYSDEEWQKLNERTKNNK